MYCSTGIQKVAQGPTEEHIDLASHFLHVCGKLVVLVQKSLFFLSEITLMYNLYLGINLLREIKEETQVLVLLLAWKSAGWLWTSQSLLALRRSHWQNAPEILPGKISGIKVDLKAPKEESKNRQLIEGVESSSKTKAGINNQFEVSGPYIDLKNLVCITRSYWELAR